VSIHPEKIPAVYKNLTHGSFIQASQQIEQSGFSAAAVSDNRH
jgi:hypothetical protein